MSGPILPAVSPIWPSPVWSDERADPSSRVAYLAEPGVVGRIDKCREGWCRIRIDKRTGYVRAADLWGVGKDETLD
jgi:SH3-like domain-containing protein